MGTTVPPESGGRLCGMILVKSLSLLSRGRASPNTEIFTKVSLFCLAAERSWQARAGLGVSRKAKQGAESMLPLHAAPSHAQLTVGNANNKNCGLWGPVGLILCWAPPESVKSLAGCVKAGKQGGQGLRLRPGGVMHGWRVARCPGALFRHRHWRPGW